MGNLPGQLDSIPVSFCCPHASSRPPTTTTAASVLLILNKIILDIDRLALSLTRRLAAAARHAIAAHAPTGSLQIMPIVSSTLTLYMSSPHPAPAPACSSSSRWKITPLCGSTTLSHVKEALEVESAEVSSSVREDDPLVRDLWKKMTGRE
jgi:hypothetical protein